MSIDESTAVNDNEKVNNEGIITDSQPLYLTFNIL